MTVFEPHPNLRCLLAGSGSDGLNEPAICTAILDLVGKPPSETVVLYLGTATYDLPAPEARQTARFRDAGCDVRSLRVADPAAAAPPAEAMRAAVAAADVALVGGGNTLFAVDRWRRVGLDKLLRDGAERVGVLCHETCARPVRVRCGTTECCSALQHDEMHGAAAGLYQEPVYFVPRGPLVLQYACPALSCDGLSEIIKPLHVRAACIFRY
jgi:hypothetical protein